MKELTLRQVISILLLTVLLIMIGWILYTSYLQYFPRVLIIR